MAKTYGDGRWITKHQLSEGGQAVAFIVTDSHGDGKTQYVLKRLKNLNRVSRFKKEIEAIRNLSHESIIQLVDFDLGDDKPYLVTEFCEGGSLRTAEPFWQVSPVPALELFHTICKAIEYVHSKGVIHRDIKPDNIFLKKTNGPPVVGDFGICLIENTDERLTLTDEAVGPRLFMAPELEDGRLDRVTEKVDSYSLGKLLYWLLREGKMFAREKHRDPEFDLKVKNHDKLLGWNNIYMEHVNRLLDKMITRDPKDRFPVSTIAIVTRSVIRLVEKEYNPVDPNIRQPCVYCGEGVYQSQATTNTEVSNFGFRAVGNPDWRIFTCSECGHVQSFRVDLAKRKEWWLQ